MKYYRDSDGESWIDEKRADSSERYHAPKNLRPNPYDPEKVYDCYESSCASVPDEKQAIWIGDLRTACSEFNDLMPDGYWIDVGYDDQYRNQALIYGPTGIIAKTEY